MYTLVIIVTVLLAYLIVERILLGRHRKAIALRIGVTGTRGKSSVSRMLASVLHEDGKKVLAKTTGSRPCMIYPDGEEIHIKRRGSPSIIEQIRVVRKASEIQADCLIAEIMSIHPENHYVESQGILKPHLVVVTNIRSDHIDAMGDTEEAIGSVIGLDIPENATVFVLEKECTSSISAAVQKAQGTLIKIPSGASQHLQALDPDILRMEFPDNIDLVYGVARYLHIPEACIMAGIRKTRQDLGSFKVWKVTHAKARKSFFLVNAFAANDPVSTMRIIEKLKDRFQPDSIRYVGILNLRFDRGDRTLQWIHALENGMGQVFERIFVVGGHARVVKRTLKTPIILTERQPEKMMAEIYPILEDKTVLFGFGNIEGPGAALIDHWNRIGEVYGL